MIELENNRLRISFPEVHGDAHCSIDFQRTLRIPDDGREYPLPAGLGSFPLNHIEDFGDRIPESWCKRGGVLMPMYQSEALWLNFGHSWYSGASSYPMAVKVAAGKINAVTGEQWKDGLSGEPQDYLVLPDQPWLDGYNVEKDLIRQFVAMPLGQGYSVEEQLTGAAEFGGLQIIVFPMRWEVYDRMKAERTWKEDPNDFTCYSSFESAPAMGLAVGGLMRQRIYEDKYGVDVWDTEHSSRCFIHLVNSETYASIMGKNPPHPPITKKEYADHGVPWFDYYDDGKALSGSETLSKVKSLSKVADEKGDKIWDNESINIGPVKKTNPNKHLVSEGGWGDSKEVSMNKDGVSTAFKLIIEEIELLAKTIEQEGSEAFKEGRFSDAKELAEDGQNLRVFKTKTEQLAEEWENSFDKVIRRKTDTPIETSPKSKKTKLCVRFKDGTEISEHVAADTFVEAIAKIGINKIGHLGISVRGVPLVGEERSTQYVQRRVSDKYIITHSSTKEKADILTDIAKRLKLGLSVDIVQ